MAVIIGGSGSTGSSLFKNLLNNHSKIFAGVETSLFCKKQLYTNWSVNKGRLLKRGWKGLPNHSWMYYRGVDLVHSGFGWEAWNIHEMAMEAIDFPQFCDRFFARPLKKKGASVWIEKTPSNAACFTDFLNCFPKGKVIHIARDPCDTMSSLMRRGFNLYYALGIYILNTAAALACRHDPRYLLVKYEDLVGNPKSVLTEVCHFLNLDFEDGMTKMDQIEANFETRQKGWNYDETEPIKTGSVGAFDKLEPVEKEHISAGLNMLRISNSGKRRYQTPIEDLTQICELLKYPQVGTSTRSKNEIYPTLIQQKWGDIVFRMGKLCPKSIFHPLKISK